MSVDPEAAYSVAPLRVMASAPTMLNRLLPSLAEYSALP
jgi:hypothetical protein